MTALMEPMSATRSDTPITRPFSPALRTVARVRPVSDLRRRTAPAALTSRFATCVRRCRAAGVRLVVTAPTDSISFARGIGRFPRRQIDPGAHLQWDAAYRAFCGRELQAPDRGSWRILAVDRDDRVVGAITGRFFCGEVDARYLHVLSLLDTTGPVFREHCELAVSEVMATSNAAGRTPAEISHWAVAPVWHAALIAVTLIRAMGVLVSAFDVPLAILAADNRRGEVNRLMRLGCKPLSLAGRSCLPPFVHHESGAWLRLLVLDVLAIGERSRSTSTADLALLREDAAIISAS